MISIKKVLKLVYNLTKIKKDKKYKIAFRLRYK